MNNKNLTEEKYLKQINEESTAEEKILDTSMSSEEKQKLSKLLTIYCNNMHCKEALSNLSNYQDKMTKKYLNNSTIT